ncbi:unnamed protein product [Penicillium discolor]
MSLFVLESSCYRTRLLVVGTPPSHIITSGVATNIAGAYLRKKSGVMAGQTALSVADESAVAEGVERWLKHGFFPYPTLPKDVANAYLRNNQNYNQHRANLNVGWQRGFLERNQELADDLAEERETIRLRGPHEERRAWRYFNAFKDIK